MAIELIDQIIPKNGGKFAMVNSDDVKGGLHECLNETERDAIHSSVRKIGMICCCTESDKTYQLKGGIENTNWQLYNPSSSQIADINGVITALVNRIQSLEDRVQALESGSAQPSAIVGTFKVGELKANEGLPATPQTFQTEQYEVAPIPSALSNNFKKKLKK